MKGLPGANLIKKNEIVIRKNNVGMACKILKNMNLIMTILS